MTFLPDTLCSLLPCSPAPLQKLCILLESVWHLHRLCHNQAQNMALGQQQQQPQQQFPPAWHASQRRENGFVQQLRSEWFAEGREGADGLSRQQNLSCSTRKMGGQVLDNALEVARDKLQEAAHQVGPLGAMWVGRALIGPGHLGTW
jgi:hypothetical protein